MYAWLSLSTNFSILSLWCIFFSQKAHWFFFKAAHVKLSGHFSTFHYFVGTTTNQNRSQNINYYSRSINGIYTLFFLLNFILKKCWEKELEIELNRSQRALKTEWIVMNGFCIDVGNRSMYDASNEHTAHTNIPKSYTMNERL